MPPVTGGQVFALSNWPQLEPRHRQSEHRYLLGFDVTDEGEAVLPQGALADGHPSKGDSMRGNGPQKVKFAVAGCGNIGSRHLHHISANADAQLVGLCDSDAAVASKFASQYQVRGYTDYRQLVHESGAEVISICTPHALHAPMTIDAVAAGKHVLVEKPMALNGGRRAADEGGGRRQGRPPDDGLAEPLQRSSPADLQGLAREASRPRFSWCSAQCFGTVRRITTTRRRGAAGDVLREARFSRSAVTSSIC